jgi:uncharacterized protein YdaT
MPWNASNFKLKHNKKLTPVKAAKAAKVANAVLKDTGNEGLAVRVANTNAQKKRGKK